VVTEVPKMIEWARSLQAIAQSGLAWEPTEYDRQRYEAVRGVAADMLADGNGVEGARIEGWFAAEVGHATPKLDVRGVVFRDAELLLVREREGGGWSLPGGWVDVGESPSGAVAREVHEESGYRVRPVKLLGLYDRDARGFPPHMWHIWKAFFLCDLVDTEPRQLGYETTASGFFARDALPTPLRFAEATERELLRCFDQRGHPEWPTEFD
jgi:ADP-ribose pyrophosphatase YjhB (NUDIX family)